MRISDWSSDVCSSDLKLVPIVQEYVLNTYIKYDQYDVKAADDYWAATKEYWAAVRAEWDRVAATKGGIAIEEKADTGSSEARRGGKECVRTGRYRGSQ